MKGIQIGILVLLFVIAALLGALIFQQSPKGTEETAAVEPSPAAELPPRRRPPRSRSRSPTGRRESRLRLPPRPRGPAAQSPRLFP